MSRHINSQTDSKLESQNMKQTTKQIKVGFKMKPIRFLTIALVLMGLVSMLNAAGTAAGTPIQNQASGSYKDANGNAQTGITSNIVTTLVSQVAGASFSSDQSQNISASTAALFDVTFQNSGNGKDMFTLVAADAGGQTGDFVYEIYVDLGNDGAIDGLDSIVVATDSLNADAYYNLLVLVTDTTSGGAPEADAIVVTLTATSGFLGTVSDDIVLTTIIQAATLTATITVDNSSPIPGDVLTYAICISNSGSATAYNVVLRNGIPSYTTYVDSSMRSNTSGTYGGTLITDNDGDDIGDFNITSTDTITVNIGTIAGGGSICILYKVSVNAGAPELTPIVNNPVIELENISGTPYTDVTPTGDDTTPIAESFGVDIASTGTTSFTGDPSDTLYYTFTVQNLGNGTDNFDLDYDSTYVIWTFYAADGGGNPIGSPLTATGNLGQNVVGNYVAVGVIPIGTADTATDASNFTATSQGDAGETDFVSASATCTAPELTLVKTVTQGGSTYGTGDANSAAPGDTLTYTIIVANGGSGVATIVVVSDVIPANTTYVPESMTIEGSSVDDASNTDGGTKTGTSVVFDFATLPAYTEGDNTDQHILTFQVTID